MRSDHKIGPGEFSQGLRLSGIAVVSAVVTTTLVIWGGTVLTRPRGDIASHHEASRHEVSRSGAPDPGRLLIRTAN